MWALSGQAQPAAEHDDAADGRSKGTPAIDQLPTMAAEPERAAPAEDSATLADVTEPPFDRLPPPDAAVDLISLRHNGAGAPAGSKDEPKSPPMPASLDERPRIRWIGPLGLTGMVLAAAGLGGVALGVAFINKGTIVGPATDDLSVLIRDYTRPGWILYGSGMGATVLGAVALAVDVTVGRERRSRRMTIGPQLGHAHAGLQLRCRF